MPSRPFLAPLLGVVILAISAFFGAGVAKAHPGHVHAHTPGAAAPVQIAPAVEDVIVSTPSAAIGTEALREAHAATPPGFHVAVNEMPGRNMPGAGCVGMCCDNSPCGWCVKAAFGKASLPAPLPRAWLPASVEARKLTGRLAEGPNEPPRTFI